MIMKHERQLLQVHEQQSTSRIAVVWIPQQQRKRNRYTTSYWYHHPPNGNDGSSINNNPNEPPTRTIITSDSNHYYYYNCYEPVISYNKTFCCYYSPKHAFVTTTVLLFNDPKSKVTKTPPQTETKSPTVSSLSSSTTTTIRNRPSSSSSSASSFRSLSCQRSIICSRFLHYFSYGIIVGIFLVLNFHNSGTVVQCFSTGPSFYHHHSKTIRHTTGSSSSTTTSSSYRTPIRYDEPWKRYGQQGQPPFDVIQPEEQHLDRQQLQQQYETRNVSSTTTENGKCCNDDTTTNFWNRRQALTTILSTVITGTAFITTTTTTKAATTAATSATTTVGVFTVPTSSSLSSTTVSDPVLISQNDVVTGEWKLYNRRNHSHDNNIVPSVSTTSITTIVPENFVSYLTRFLIHYDDITNPSSMKYYWTEQMNKYHYLSIEEQSTKLQIIFSRMTYCTKYAIEQYFSLLDASNNKNNVNPYEQLWDNLYSTYGTKYGVDAERQLALLFTLLPPEQQPVACLYNYYTKHPNANQQRKVTTMKSSGELDNLIDLLPNNYRIVPIKQGTNTDTTDHLSSIYFTIQPNLPSNQWSVASSFDNNDAIEKYSSLRASSSSSSSSSSLGSLSMNNRIFGTVGTQPLIRDLQQYTLGTYLLFSLAGATSCALTHSVVIPLDVVKTRAQTNPTGAISKTTEPTMGATKVDKIGTVSTLATTTTAKRSIGIWESGRQIIEKEGISGLFLGAEATIVGYFWYGLSVYPTYTFVKRYLTLSGIVPIDYAAVHGNEIAIVAGAVAAVIASFGVTPLEAARIRVVAEPQIYRPLGLVATLQVIATENPTMGWQNLYAGLPPLLIRQVLFGSIKFVAFEQACDVLYTVFPEFRSALPTQLLVSLLAGAFSGVIASIMSQPADSVLTYVARNNNNKTASTNNDSSASASSSLAVLVEGIQTMIEKEGPGSLFRGLGSRCVWAGSIIAGQFFLYDIARTIFHVTTTDLSEIYVLSFH